MQQTQKRQTRRRASYPPTKLGSLFITDDSENERATAMNPYLAFLRYLDFIGQDVADYCYDTRARTLFIAPQLTIGQGISEPSSLEKGAIRYEISRKFDPSDPFIEIIPDISCAKRLIQLSVDPSAFKKLVPTKLSDPNLLAGGTIVLKDYYFDDFCNPEMPRYYLLHAAQYTIRYALTMTDPLADHSFVVSTMEKGFWKENVPPFLADIRVFKLLIDAFNINLANRPVRFTIIRPNESYRALTGNPIEHNTRLLLVSWYGDTTIPDGFFIMPETQ